MARPRKFNDRLYNSKEWKALRSWVLKRDNYLCCECGAPAIDVHHIIHLTPENIGDKSIAFNPDNLVSLCKDCHRGHHHAEKVRGIRRKYNLSDVGEEYIFDENGYLVRKNSESPLSN